MKKIIELSKLNTYETRNKKTSITKLLNTTKNLGNKRRMNLMKIFKQLTGRIRIHLVKSSQTEEEEVIGKFSD